jgi:hypothetical protein
LPIGISPKTALPGNPRFKCSKLLHLNRRLLHLIRGLISPRISDCADTSQPFDGDLGHKSIEIAAGEGLLNEAQGET